MLERIMRAYQAAPPRPAVSAGRMMLAGEVGDGFITSRTNSLEGWQQAWNQVQRGAEKAGKDPVTLYTTMLTTTCLLRSGEEYNSPRVINRAGPWALMALHALYERVQNPTAAPIAIQPIFAQYQTFIDEQKRRLGDRYYLSLHDGHGMYLQPDEARFATPEVIRATTMTAVPEELVERLRALERAGVKQVAFIPAAETFDEFVREVSEKVIAKF